MSEAAVLGAYVGTFVDELADAGVRDVCLCPGSRSTPLALAFARQPRIKLWTHLDERSCAYFALGLASEQPTAILCSSGTAALNFAPAVAEAFHSHRPLLVLTADRPQELRDLGANQTIDQVRLYGGTAKWFVEMPLPEASEQMLRYVGMVARRSVRTARGPSPGPVHLNFPFREPLIPSGHQPRLNAETKVVEKGASEAERPPKLEELAPISSAPPGSIADQFLNAERPLIVCGPRSYANYGAVKRLAGAGVPILADGLSDLRTCGSFFGPQIIGSYDNFLREGRLAESLRPDLILRFGAPPTSKPLATYLYRHRDVSQVVLPTFGDWPDPDLTASAVASDSHDTDAVWDSLSRCVSERPDGWLAAWQEAEAASLKAIRGVVDSDEALSEPSAILDLADAIPEAHAVFAGNSMPVRDIDSFWPASAKLQFFYANRGVSGIDGVVSSTLGAAARADGRLVLVIGDIAFYHDMNGLLAAQRFGLKATIVLINNDGGGIFSFLPQHEDAEHFETLWGTRHGLDFAHVAGLYGVGFQRVTTRAEYVAALKASFHTDGVQVIEIKTDREANLALHQRIWRAVADALTPAAAP